MSVVSRPPLAKLLSRGVPSTACRARRIFEVVSITLIKIIIYLCKYIYRNIKNLNIKKSKANLHFFNFFSNYLLSHNSNKQFQIVITCYISNNYFVFIIGPIFTP